MHVATLLWEIIQKSLEGAAVIAASMHGFANCWKFKSPVTLTLTLDQVKVISACTIPVGLPASPTIWLQRHALPKYGHLNFMKYQHSGNFELLW